MIGHRGQGGAMLSMISSGSTSGLVDVWKPGRNERLAPGDIEALGLPALAKVWREGGAGASDAIRETYETAMAAGDAAMAEVLSKRAGIVDALMRSGGAGVVAVQTSHNGNVTQIMTAAEFEEWRKGEGFSSDEAGKPEPSKEAKTTYDAVRKLSIMQMVSEQLARMRADNKDRDTDQDKSDTKANKDVAQSRPTVDEMARKALTDVLGEGWKWTTAVSGTTSDGTRVTVGVIGGIDSSRLPPELARGNSLRTFA